MIVEFLEDNLFVDGWSLGPCPGGKLEVVAASRTVKLQPKRILVAAETPDPGTADGRMALVAAADAARAGLSARVDLEVIWGLLEEEQAAALNPEAGGAAALNPEAGGAAAPDSPGASGAAPAGGQGSRDPGAGDSPEPRRMPSSSDTASRFTFAALAELEFGRGPTPDQTAAVMRAVHREGLHFKFTPEAALKRSAEEIGRILEIRAREARRAELRREGIAWLRRARIAYFGEGNRDAALPARVPDGPDTPGTPGPAGCGTPPAAYAPGNPEASGSAASPRAPSPAVPGGPGTPETPETRQTAEAPGTARSPALSEADGAEGARATEPADGPESARSPEIPEASGADPAGRLPPPPDDGGILVKSLTELALAVEDPPPSLRSAAEALAEAGFSGDPAGAARALEAAGIFRPHENLELRRLGLPLEFPEEALEEAARLTESGRWRDEDRLDLTGELVITVDSPGAMEFDDAVSLKPGAGGGMTLGVHIADAAAFVKPGSALDRFAAERGASIYLPEGRHPMLPLKLTENALSLTANAERPAFSILAEIGRDGQVTDAVFRPSVVKVARHLTFIEADEILEGGGDRELAPFLAELAELSQRFLKLRLAAGGHLFNIPTQQVTMSAAGVPETALVMWGTPSCVAVGELMIRANHLAATTLRNADFPCPYRYQLLMKGSQSPLSCKSERTPREQLAYHLALRRRLGRTGVSAEPSRHRGLGLDCYTYFTSPMRRYFDLLVHRQLRALAAGEGPAYDEKALLGEAFNADGVLRAIHKVQSARTRYWILWELAKLEGDTLPALCFDRQGRRVRVCLTDWMMETESMSFPDSVEPGHELYVRLTRADPVRNALECSFVANLTLDSSIRV